MVAAFVLDAMAVKAVFQSALLNNIVAYHPKLWFGVRFRIMDDPICYKLRVISIAAGTSVKCYNPKSLPSFKASLELSFSRLMNVHMLQRLFETSVQPMHLLLWSSYSPDMSPIEHVWELVGRRLARDPRPPASKDELLLRIQTIWNSLPQADIKNLFDSVPRRTAALIAARDGYTKY
ncbi:uncharacterized protein TNCV_3819031 [Trichonephila clavipes]|nr:uncharacterized protein TNCV_3819031 [Trichonephila clavipes]